MSTEDLTGECQRRGLVVLDGADPVELPGLIVHTGGRIVHWRGGEYVLLPYEGRVVLALAHVWPGVIKGPALTLAIWGPFADGNLGRIAVAAVRRRCPGLVERLGYSGYRLALEADG